MGGELWIGKEGRPRRRALDGVTSLTMVEVVVRRRVMDFGVSEMSDAAASLHLPFTWGGVVETRSGGSFRGFEGCGAACSLESTVRYLIPVLAQGLNPHECKEYCKR